MPVPFQIVPPYLHPHVYTRINDNTRFEDEVAIPEEPLRSMHWIVSSEGRDGQFIIHETEPSAREEFGSPNYKLHGQPIYNVYEALKSQQARTATLRVMPEDASYANVVLMAKVKIDQTSGKKMVIRFTAQSIENLRDASDFSTQVELLEKPDTQSDGYKHIPVMAIRIAGKGEYGNKFRFRLTRAMEEDRIYPYSFFRMEILKNVGSLIRKETHIGATFFDAHDGPKSLYMEDVVNDRGPKGSKIVQMQIIESNIKQIYEMYKTEVDNDTALTLENFDIFFGFNKATEDEDDKIPNLEYNTEEDFVNISATEGITIINGDDGAFKYDETQLSQRQKKIDDAYVKAMSFQHNKLAFSKARLPIDVIYDANYSKDVKKALIALILKRGDCYGYIDAGIIKSLEDAIRWGTEMKTLADRSFSKEFQHYDIRDSYTGKRITMTTTYFLAGMLPIHFRINGRHIPFQGEQNARLVGYLKDSVYPVVDMDDLENKETLYKLQMNYYEFIGEDVIIRGTAGTSQNFFSDLSEENNMHVLFYYKRAIERMVASKIYKFGEAEDRARFTDEAKRLIAPGVGIHFRSADVKFDMNAWEEERSILHCYLEIIFRTIIKRAIIEIDINKRV